jgi:transcriptional regulator with XRE-family HTH domain
MNGDRQPVEADLVVGANIRRLRNEQRLTLQDLASQLGMSHQQLQKYETGSNRVSAGVLYPVARALSVPVDALFEGVDDGSPSDLEAKALHLARNRCHAIVNRASSVPVLDSMAKVLRALRDKD